MESPAEALVGALLIKAPFSPSLTLLGHKKAGRVSL